MTMPKRLEPEVAIVVMEAARRNFHQTHPRLAVLRSRDHCIESTTRGTTMKNLFVSNSFEATSIISVASSNSIHWHMCNKSTYCSNDINNNCSRDEIVPSHHLEKKTKQTNGIATNR